MTAPTTTVISLPASTFRALHANVATDDVRFYLHSYYLDRSPAGEYRLTATDGHALVRFTLPDNAPEDFQPLIIPALARQIGKSAEMVHISITGSYPTREIRISAESKTGKAVAVATAEHKEIDMKYPGVESVVPTRDAGALDGASPMHSVNPLLIARTVEHLTVPCVRLWYTPKGGAIRVEVAGRDNLEMVVMPARW